ncbi:unknown [Haloarcula marismortui ATCC 43049]|uniref:DUF308 domain-containing protein n=1 Tax=Haloarcula marismortui (strain ATCC 43049 / DSM 3752 / JCM 8966 / VKM B-1809) TaxID=272569 RepID=Q5V5E9_HALMA|nr:hypothetical protein [Haloarcula marismortui]AAV45253.1 unknown [Haloarcula marismortui ATCC 43049]QCP93032.1 hypothetical protein E6P14_19995 [Haloarcula marismortui ATCC 43049]
MAKLRCQRAGAVAAVGGVVWVGWAVVLSATGQTEMSTSILAGTALSALGVVAGHYAIEDFYGARMKRPGTIGAWAGGLGGLVFAIGQLVRLLSGGGEAVIAVGVLVLVSGSLLVTVGLVRTRIQPPWLGVLLGLGTIAFLGFEVQPAAATVYGLAWVALGQDLYRFDPPDGRFGDADGDYGWLS